MTKKKSESEGKKAAKGIGLLSVGRLLGTLISFGSMAVLARLLIPADFGIMTTSLIVIALATAVFDGAFAIGLVQRKEINDEYVSSAFWLSLILAFILFLLICIATPFVSVFFHSNGYQLMYVISGSSLIFKAVENTSLAYLRRTSRFKHIVLYQVASSLIGYGPVSIALALQGYGAWSLVWGQFAVSVLAGAGAFYLAKLPLKFVLTRGAIRDIFETSGHFTASQVLNWAALTGSNSVVAHMLGVKELGLYSRAWKLLDIATAVSAAPFSSVLVPAFSRMQSEPSKANSALRKALELTVPFFAVFSALVVVHAQAVVDICLGKKWGASVPLIQLLFCALIPRCCYKITESAMVGFGRSKSVASRQLLYAGLMVGGAIVAAPFGALWIAVSTSLAVTLFYITSLTFAARLVDMKVAVAFAIHARAIGLAVAIGLIDFLVTLGLGHLGFWVSQIAGGIVALALVGVSILTLPEFLIGREWPEMGRKIAGKLPFGSKLLKFQK